MLQVGVKVARKKLLDATETGPNCESNNAASLQLHKTWSHNHSEDKRSSNESDNAKNKAARSTHAQVKEKSWTIVFNKEAWMHQ